MLDGATPHACPKCPRRHHSATGKRWVQLVRVLRALRFSIKEGADIEDKVTSMRTSWGDAMSEAWLDDEQNLLIVGNLHKLVESDRARTQWQVGKGRIEKWMAWFRRSVKCRAMLYNRKIMPGVPSLANVNGRLVADPDKTCVVPRVGHPAFPEVLCGAQLVGGD